MAYGRVLIMQSLIKAAIPSQANILTYDGKSKTPTWNNYNSEIMTLGGIYRSQTDAGTYYAEFTLAVGYCWEDGTTGTKSVAWTINQQRLNVPSISDTTQTFDGTTKHPTIGTYKANLISVSGDSGVNLGKYTLTFSLKDKKNYCWADGSVSDKSVDWNIVAQTLPSELSTFSQSETLIFDSTTQTVTIVGYDERYHILGGVISGFDAKTYNATVAPKNGYIFANGSTNPITVPWKIDVRVLNKPVASQTAFDYGNSYNISDYVSKYDAKYMTMSGTVTAQTEPNSYSTTYTLKSTTNTKWSDNTTAAVKISWSIGAMRIPKPKVKADVPLIDGVPSYPYTGSTIELGVDNFNAAYMSRSNYSGSTVKIYTATFTLSNTKKAVREDGSTASVTISWKIYKKNVLAVPTVTGKAYTGSKISPTIST